MKKSGMIVLCALAFGLSRLIEQQRHFSEVLGIPLSQVFPKSLVDILARFSRMGRKSSAFPVMTTGWI